MKLTTLQRPQEQVFHGVDVTPAEIRRGAEIGLVAGALIRDSYTLLDRTVTQGLPAFA